jgi:hypothetical protein
VAVEFAKGLVVSEVLSADGLERALFVAASNDSPLEHALLDTGALTAEKLEAELSRADAPSIQGLEADIDLLDRLPAGLCTRLLVVPLRFDERSNTVDLAVVNAFDAHAAEEVAFHLGANVVAMRASLEQVESALRDRPSYAQILSARPEKVAARPRMRDETPPPDPTYSVRRTPMWGTGLLSGTPREEPSEIPIPLTRRRSTFAPALDPLGDESVASITYSRLGGGLSLPDAELVRSRSSVPVGLPEPEDGSLQIDSLPAAAVEVAPSRTGRTSSVPTRREPEVTVSPATLRRADLPPPPDAELLDRPLTLSLIPPSITLREPVTTRNVAPRPPPPSALARNPSAPPGPPSHPPAPLSVRAPSAADPQRGSMAPSAGSAPEPSQVLAALKSAPDRDAILGLVLAGARVVARRVAIFVVRRGSFVGWLATPGLASSGEITALEIPADAPTVLAWASAEGTYLGPLDPSTHGPLVAALRTVSREMAAVPIRVHGRTAVVVLADELGDTLIATKRLEEIAAVAGEALARIVRAAKK